MRTIDMTPLFRSTVGFDRLTRALDAALQGNDTQTASYPPYDIEKLDENAYRITMAVAGFGDGDIDVVDHDGTLTVKGKTATEGEAGRYLHKGIARRAFERSFQLADTIKVKGATLADGLLHIDLAREVPEHQRPRRIEITRSAAPALTEQAQKAA